MAKYDYLIVGAGLFGATFANSMHQAGKKCLVVEKSECVAGHTATKRIDNIDVHIFGAHIFHTSNQKVWDYVNQFATFNHYINSPIAVYKDSVYNLPFNMNTFAKMWNIKTPEEARTIIERQKEQYGVPQPNNLEEQAINMVGKDIYEILIKGYTEKQWGMKATELPASIIKRLPVRFTYDNNYFDDTHQGIPIDGYTNMVEQMLSGIEVRLNTDYFKHLDELNQLADKVVYTGPIDRFFDYCFGPLEYRSLRFEQSILDTENYQGNAVVNYTERDIPYTRIIEHKHFNPRPNQPKTIITKEYPQDWNLDRKPFYPINNEKNQLLLKRYLDLAKKQKHVIFGGRLAEYKYYNMDKVIESALERVNKELK